MHEQPNLTPDTPQDLTDLQLLDDATAPIPSVTPDASLADLSALEEVPGDAVPPADGAVPQDTRFINPVRKTELLPDETALSAAGLTAHTDSELDKIMREAMQDDFLAPGAAAAPAAPTEPQDPPVFPPEEFKDQEFRHAFGEGEELASAFQPEEPAVAAEPEKPKKSQRTKPVDPFNGRKRRPKMKKGYGFFGIPHIAVTAVWLAIILLIGLSLGRLVWVCAEDMLGFGRTEKLVEFTFTEEDTLEDLAQRLHKAGLIRYPQLFVFYGQISDIMEKIDPGTYTLNAAYDYMALKNGLVDYGSTGITTVTIPEGYNCRQIFALLEEKGVCTAAELGEYAAWGELDEYWFLEDVPRGKENCLEGFLFPDTYDFYLDDEPRRVIEKLLDGFDYRFTDAMLASLEDLNDHLADLMREHGHSEGFIESQKMSLYDVVIVASLVEEEIATQAEGYTIASVIYNRLTNPDRYPYLNIDASIIYAIGSHKTELTAEDLKLDHPYNTYLYPGLTPGPITNPGLDSLKAALKPEHTGYHFYALDPETGLHHFSRDLSEHEDFLDSLKD